MTAGQLQFILVVLGFTVLMTFVVLSLIAYRKIFERADCPKYWFLLMFIPIVNIVLLSYIALSKWPNTKDKSDKP